MKVEYIETMPSHISFSWTTLPEQWSYGMKLVVAFVDDPTGELASIYNQCREDPTDLVEIGRVALQSFDAFERPKQKALGDAT